MENKFNNKNFYEYRSLYKVAGFATLAMLIIIPIQIIFFTIAPPPKQVIGWFELFNKNWLIGFVDSDFLFTINNILLVVIYLALYHSIRARNKGLMLIALLSGVLGIAAYLSSTMTFEMFKLSGMYMSNHNEAIRSSLIASGQTLLLNWQGTAFNAYYVLNGITLLIIASIMLKSDLYGKKTGIIGLIAGFFMIIPSTAGMIGLVFSLLSLIPWYIFSIRFAVVFFKISKIKGV